MPNNSTDFLPSISSVAKDGKIELAKLEESFKFAAARTVKSEVFYGGRQDGLGTRAFTDDMAIFSAKKFYEYADSNKDGAVTDVEYKTAIDNINAATKVERAENGNVQNVEFVSSDKATNEVASNIWQYETTRCPRLEQERMERFLTIPVMKSPFKPKV